MKPLLRLACLFVALFIALPSELWARGSSSRGGSFSSGRSSSSSSSSRSSGGSSFGSGRASSGSSSGSSWGSSGGSSSRTSTSSSSGSSWGSSSRFSNDSSSARNTSAPNSSSSTQRSGPTSSATDQALGRKVGQGANTFSSRSDAVKDFSQKHAGEYKSTFPQEPGSRPDYIPRSTSVGGNTYNVYYDRGYGGYGYMMGNRWMAYSVMSDAVMMGSLMNRHNYSYYDNGPGYGYSGSSYRSSSSSGGGVFVGLLFIVILIIAAVVVVKYLSSKKAVASSPFVGGGAATKMGTPPPVPVRDLKTSPMDKSKAADWLAVRPNSIVTISDAQGIADSMKRGLGVRGIDYTVRSIGRLKQVDGLSTHMIFTLYDEEQLTYLVVKIVDDLIDLGLYFEVDGLAPGTRRELVDRGALWLFQEPASPQNFDPADLRYTTNIRQTLPKAGGGQEEVFYEIKPQGELQCDYTESPPRSGMGGALLATLVEYRTAQQTENPEFLILEIGEKNGASSYVQFFLGCGVKFSEVDVLPA